MIIKTNLEFSSRTYLFENEKMTDTLIDRVTNYIDGYKPQPLATQIRNQVVHVFYDVRSYNVIFNVL